MEASTTVLETEGTLKSDAFSEALRQVEESWVLEHPKLICLVSYRFWKGLDYTAYHLVNLLSLYEKQGAKHVTTQLTKQKKQVEVLSFDLMYPIQVMVLSHAFKSLQGISWTDEDVASPLF